MQTLLLIFFVWVCVICIVFIDFSTPLFLSYTQPIYSFIMLSQLPVRRPPPMTIQSQCSQIVSSDCPHH